MTTIVRLGEVCHTTSGGTPSRSRPEFFAGTIPWVKSGNLNDGLVHDIDESISAQGLASSSAKLFPAGTLLIAMYGATVGKLGILGKEAATNQAVCGIQPNQEIDRDFLFYCLLHKRKELIGKSVGGAQPNISQAIIRDTLIPLPPLDEQQRIVGLLDRAAEIRRRADAARAKARAIIPALFLDMFGHPATGWPEVAIADLLADQPNAIRTGPFGSQIKHSEFTDEGVPVLGIDNVVDNEFKWAKPRHLPPEKYEAFKRFRVFPGDVIITIMGTTGRVCVAPDDLPECMNTKHLCAFTLDRSRAHPRFIWAALLFDPGVRAQARGKANGQIMEGWNMGIVRSMRLPLPPLPLQTAFAEQANRLDALARALDAAAAKADSMAAALSAEVFG